MLGNLLDLSVELPHPLFLPGKALQLQLVDSPDLPTHPVTIDLDGIAAPIPMIHLLVMASNLLVSQHQVPLNRIGLLGPVHLSLKYHYEAHWVAEIQPLQSYENPQLLQAIGRRREQYAETSLPLDHTLNIHYQLIPLPVPVFWLASLPCPI